ncbi:lysozyme [Streptomyces sp. RB6PN25]|uniref:Lysozyme n=1 Tax=Streptomyces humicola TaxID=2953240 RepID=A0ABT1PPE7_9ACTN|nr:lysozyme [Streptomyces humicola]MCQ4079549.1 lysozyme [Streptomyces humicola]
MPRHRTGPTAVLAALVAALAVLLGAPAAGAATPRNRVTHPQLDWAGSTIPSHERGNPRNHPVVPFVTQTPGMDVSAYQGDVDWTTAWNNGARFAYIKATESTTYTNPYFAQQYDGSYDVGMIRGAYHFATPDTSSGTAQADYFVDNGGGWSADGKTLPPALDIEYNPYGAECYGLSQSGMVGWISDFSNEVHARTGRYPVIYSTTDWWTTCTGNSSAFGADNPLWIASYTSTPGTLPAGWGYQTFWQYADSGTFPGDQDYFNGDYSQLQALADG